MTLFQMLPLSVLGIMSLIIGFLSLYFVNKKVHSFNKFGALSFVFLMFSNSFVFISSYFNIFQKATFFLGTKGWIIAVTWFFIGTIISYIKGPLEQKRNVLRGYFRIVLGVIFLILIALFARLFPD